MKLLLECGELECRPSLKVRIKNEPASRSVDTKVEESSVLLIAEVEEGLKETASNEFGRIWSITL